MAEKKIFLGLDLTKEGYTITSYDFVKNEPAEQVEYNTKLPEQYHSMVMTVEQLDYAGWEATKQFMKQYHISQDNVRVVTHLHAFLAFLTHQELGIWDHNVGLFEYKKEGLFYHQININKSKMPIRAHLTTTSYAHVLGPDSFHMEKTVIDQEFVHIVRQVMTRGVISAVYLTGEGFQQDWLNESIDVLCASRRVFMGQDLFAKGACYLAKQDWEATVSDTIIISGEGFIDYEIGIMADVDEKEEFIPIITPGREWYLTKGSRDVILKKGTKVDIIYRNQQGQVVEREVLDLTFLPKRPDGTNRIRISIDFTGKNQGGITVKDLGFGTLFPTTNQVYRKEFMLD
jgi:hypothetical protein